MKVEAIVRHKGANVVTIGQHVSVKTAADRLRLENIAALVVVEAGAIVGLISEREIVRAFSRHGERLVSMPVRDVMTRDVPFCDPDDDLRHIMTIMTQHRVRHLPVLRAGVLVGIVSIGDAVKHRLDDLELEARVLRDAYLAVH